MKLIVSSMQMRMFDSQTCDKQKITSYDLMNHVGLRLTDWLVMHQKIIKKDRILVIAGIGNNGGDALKIADSLHHKGFTVQVVIVGDRLKGSDEFQTMLSHCHSNLITTIQTMEELKTCEELFQKASVIIDGLFGIGLTRALEGLYLEVVKEINHAKARTYSIDIASGLHADHGLVLSDAVQADETLVIQALKYGHLLQDGQDYSGVLQVIDVGIFIDEELIEHFLMEHDDVTMSFPKRRHHSHKYDYGHLAVLGGSKNMMGAPTLAALAAARCGVGLITLGVHVEALKHYVFKVPELMVQTYQTKSELKKISEGKQALVVGPGLGKLLGFYKEAIETLVRLNIPMLIDADGLHYIKDSMVAAQAEHCVITPHFGEFARLCHVTSETLKKDPMTYFETMRKDYAGVILLKGPVTLIGDKQRVFWLAEGTPALAKAGSGDVLSGIIGAFMTLGYDPFEAAWMGTIIHAKAARHAESILGEDSVMASDIIEAIPAIVQSYKVK